MKTASQRALVAVQRRARATDLTRGLLQRVVRQTLADEQAGLCDVSVLLTDDAEIHDLNRQWRGVDKPTDVLSFPLLEEVTLPAPSERDEPLPLGDLVISLDTARREAEARGAPLDEVVAHLAVHGVLHLLGYDHAEPEETADMRMRERRTLEHLGWRPVMWDVPDA